MDKIKVIIFDLGGVIFENGTRKAKIFLKDKYRISEELLNKIFYGREAQLFRNGQAMPKEFWNYVDQILKNNHIDIGKEEFKNIWYDFYKPDGKIFELLEVLKEKYELGIVSGNIKERILFLNKKYKFRKYFDWEIYSFNVGANKPNLNLYRAIFKKTKCKAENCLYVDDKDIFLEPAKKLGIKTLLFVNYDNFLKDLNRLNVI